MLAVLTTHPIQYQVPLWQMLARDGGVPFEVWYLTRHGVEKSVDRDFGQSFAWDLNTLKGYPHRFLQTPAGATPNTFWQCRSSRSFAALLREHKVDALWVNGWQIAGYWQAVWAAHRLGVKVWLRGESNNLGKIRNAEGGIRNGMKRLVKRKALGALFKRVDQFLCIGTANRELYRSYGVPESKLHLAFYAVDNDRFRRQADGIRGQRAEIRSQWGIPEDAFCVLFCGKFIPKKRPLDLVKAAQLLLTDNALANNSLPNVHLLFVGSGELGQELRDACHVVFDAESPPGHQQPIANNQDQVTNNAKPPASFTGFLNQTEISRAYVAADVLVLPSDYHETWGLVVNEAMASGLPCIISDRCGCAPDLGQLSGNLVSPFADIQALADCLAQISRSAKMVADPPDFCQTAELVGGLFNHS